ncbi:hypothetical protein F4825DRAFT_454591 [Nemania diffusa]|nr:hypothetical protein F4825DRAFT_454591 [Nemania diffusa]
MHLTYNFHLTGRKHVRFEQDEDQQAKKTCLGPINEESLVRQLQKLIGLHDIWKGIKPNMHIDSLTTDVPQFAVVVITTDLAELNLSSLPEPDLKEDDSKLGYSLPSSITKALINRISNEYRAATQAPDPLPSFMGAYIAMECSLALLESLPEWVLYAQSQYLDHVRTLLPVIQCCLLDSLLKTSSNWATQLIISYTPNTLDDPQVLYTVKILHRLFSRLASVDIGRYLETKWKRLQQPIMEMKAELDSLQSNLTKNSIVTVVPAENGDQSNDTAQHDEFTGTVDFFSVDDDHELQSEKGGPPSIPDKITLLELFVLFHFTDNAEDSIKSLADKTLQQSFVKERVEKFMFSDIYDDDKHLYNQLINTWVHILNTHINIKLKRRNSYSLASYEPYNLFINYHLALAKPQ